MSAEFTHTRKQAPANSRPSRCSQRISFNTRVSLTLNHSDVDTIGAIHSLLYQNEQINIPNIMSNIESNSNRGDIEHKHDNVEIEDTAFVNSDATLDGIYQQALNLMQKAEGLPRGNSRQDSYLRARRLFEQAMDITESLSLFSDNETIDEVATVNLKYLLIPAYLANIALSAECGPDRLGTLTRADRLFRQFFERILAYKLGNAAIEQSLNSSDPIASSHNASRSLEGAAQMRYEKIERYKKLKSLDSKLDELERRLKSGQEIDDEVSRDYYLHLLDKWIESSFDSFEREVKIALLFERNRPIHDSIPAAAQKAPEQPNSSKRQIQPFTIVRDEAQKHVFGLGYPSHPTVTVDQFISKKIQDGDLAFNAHREIYANSLQRYAEKPNLRREQEEEFNAQNDSKDDKDDSEELERKRRWDEFKDENPRGSGNRHNMG